MAAAANLSCTLRGVSLIETLIIVVVLSLMTMLMTSGLMPLIAKSTLTRSQAQVADAIKSARTLARAHATLVDFSISQTNGGATILSVWPYDGDATLSTLSTRVTLAANKSATFSPSGVSSADITIDLSVSGAASHAFIRLFSTGQVVQYAYGSSPQ